MSITVAAIITALISLAQLASIKLITGIFISLVSALIYALGACYMYSEALLRMLAKFVTSNNAEVRVTPVVVENRYRRIRSSLLAPFSLLTSILLIFGYFIRAAWAADAGVSFAQLNQTENLAFVSVVLLPSIASFALLLVGGSVCMADAARNLIRHGFDEVGAKLPFQKRYVDLRKIVNDWNEWSVGQRKGDTIVEKLGLDIDWRFVRNQCVELLMLAMNVCIAFVALSVLAGMIALVAFGGRVESVGVGWFVIAVFVVYTLIGPVVLSTLVMWFVLPETRWTAVLNICGFGVVLFGAVVFLFKELVDKVPQQFGGFRPEEYVASWKVGTRKDLVPSGYGYYMSADSPAKSAPADYGAKAGVGNEDDKVPQKWRIKVVYKTDKYLFLAPMCVGPPKGPSSWQSITLSTDGLESLEPARSAAAAPSNKQ